MLATVKLNIEWIVTYQKPSLFIGDSKFLNDGGCRCYYPVGNSRGYHAGRDHGWTPIRETSGSSGDDRVAIEVRLVHEGVA